MGKYKIYIIAIVASIIVSIYLDFHRLNGFSVESIAILLGGVIANLLIPTIVTLIMGTFLKKERKYIFLVLTLFILTALIIQSVSESRL